MKLNISAGEHWAAREGHDKQTQTTTVIRKQLKLENTMILALGKKTQTWVAHVGSTGRVLEFQKTTEHKHLQ